MNMHFETIANDQTYNADLKIPTTRRLLHHLRLKAPCGQTPHLPSHWKPITQLFLEANDATKKETKKPRHQVAHSEHALTHHTLASKEHLARPANWDSMSRKAKKNWKQVQANKRGREQS
jgi:hypothetical protein